MASADFVNQVYQTALSLGIPEVQARLAATQAALETNYGKSAPGNNYFGIKGKGQTLATKEASNGALKAINDSFRTYPDLTGSVQGWWDQIQRNWPEAATATNFGTAIDALNNGKHGRYATDGVEKNDPLTYQDKLASINQRFLGGTPLPPANIPSVGTQLDTTPGSYQVKSGDTLGKIASKFGTTVQQLAQANGIADPNKIRAGATLKVGVPPPLPATTYGGRLPAQAMNGIDRLTPGKVTQPPSDFTTGDVGSFDPRLSGMMTPQGILSAGGRAGIGLPTSGAASLAGMPPLPIPRPAIAPPAPVQAQPPQLPAQRPSAPVAPPQVPQLRLASGQMIAPGIYDQGDHSVMVSDGGGGIAKVERVRGPMSIPGVIDPLREANANTIAGGMIRKMLPGQLAGNASNFVPAVTDNVKSAAVNAASNLGSSIGGMFGGLFGGAPRVPSLPTFAQLQAIRAVPANSYYRPAPMPMSRPLSFFAQPQAAVPRISAPAPVAAPSRSAPSSNSGYFGGKQNAINDTLRTLGFNV